MKGEAFFANNGPGGAHSALHLQPCWAGPATMDEECRDTPPFGPRPRLQPPMRHGDACRPLPTAVSPLGSRCLLGPQIGPGIRAQDKLSSGPLAGHITRSGRDSPTAEEAVLSCEYEPHGLDGRLQLVVSSLQRRSDHCRLRQRPGVARACPDKSWRPVTMASWCLLLCFCGAQGPQPMVPQSTVPGRDACCWTAVRWPYIHIRG